MKKWASDLFSLESQLKLAPAKDVKHLALSSDVSPWVRRMAITALSMKGSAGTRALKELASSDKIPHEDRAFAMVFLGFKWWDRVSG